jgi:1-acyl-sn-glycerol-3-phosphate acyltransferase
MNPQKDPRDLRKDWLCYAVYSAVKGLIKESYDLSIKNAERLEPLKGSPFFLVSNHQSLLDIPLAEIAVRSVLDRYLFFVMKASIPDFMQYLGGIKISRTQDVERVYGTIKGRGEEIQKVREGAKLARANLYGDILPSLINSGEAVVIYPQGQRVGINETSNLSTITPRSTLNHLLQVQERVQETRQDTGFRVPFVPFYINYTPSKKPGSKIIVDVGEPRTFENNGLCALIEHLVEYVPSFRVS